MTKLLRAGFARLWRDRVFWLCLAAMCFVGVFFPVTHSIQNQGQGMTALDSMFFVFPLFTGFVAAVFGSLFIGTEYSEGTMRNKIIVGHTRAAIYLANLAVSAVAVLLSNAAYMLTLMAVGTPLIGFVTVDAATLMRLVACLALSLAFAALFTLLGMLIQSRAACAVISILCVIALFMAAVTIQQALDQPEFDEGVIITENGMEKIDPTPNPHYLGPEKRAVYQTIFDILPLGQAMQLAQGVPAHLLRLPLYALALVVFSTGLGLLCFSRRSLK